MDKVKVVFTVIPNHVYNNRQRNGQIIVVTEDFQVYRVKKNFVHLLNQNTNNLLRRENS